MMLLSILASAAVGVPPAKAQARATITVLHPARVTEQEWKAAPSRKERIGIDEFGRKLRLRTIDFE